MKDDIRNALGDGTEKTARELFDIIAPENIQRLHEALSAMRKSGELENGEDRQPGKNGGQGAKPVKTYRLADIDKAGHAVERVARRDLVGMVSHSVVAAEAERAGTTAEEWAPDAARSAASIDEIEMTERFRDAEDTDEDSIAILIHGHEELMLTYADRLGDGDPVWALMRQQYQAMLEL